MFTHPFNFLLSVSKWALHHYQAFGGICLRFGILEFFQPNPQTSKPTTNFCNLGTTYYVLFFQSWLISSNIQFLWHFNSPYFFPMCHPLVQCVNIPSLFKHVLLHQWCYNPTWIHHQLNLQHLFPLASIHPCPTSSSLFLLLSPLNHLISPQNNQAAPRFSSPSWMLNHSIA